jgi:glycosyltransferase involved in cell wall biosynthesis
VPPRVSVVMPVFNGERFITEAVESVLASDFGDLELLILLDAGSTDGSTAAARRAAGGDLRVRLIEHAHVTPSAARNIGLREARGDFIANLDCDDAMFPDRLRRQVAYLDSHPECAAVGSRALFVDAESRPVRLGVRAFSHEDIDRGHLEGRGGTIMNPTATFRREVAAGIGGYSSDLLTTGEDHDLWLRMAEVGRLVNLTDVLIRYRVHDRNASLGATTKERRNAVTLAILTRTFARRGITDRQPALVKGAPVRAWERWTERALMRYFRGDRMVAGVAALVGVALGPGAPAAWGALRTVLRGPPPRWTWPVTPPQS